MLVLEQNTHAVMARRRFDTVLKEVHREVIHFLDAIRPGRIIILATKVGRGQIVGSIPGAGSVLSY